MISYDEAIATVLTNVQALTPVELPLLKTQGLVLAAAAFARWDMPRWDNSAMDGFAFAAASVETSTTLQVVGHSFAGHPFSGQLKPGEAIRITTGAPIPDGADTAVPLEETVEEGNSVLLKNPVLKGQHVRYRGEEFQAGQELLPAGTQLHAGGISLLASAGVDQVNATPRPKVAIFSTGDELVELGQDLGPGQIVNSNLQYLIARLEECGCIPVPLGVGEDRCDDLNRLFDQAQEADLLLTTGGVSVGEKDLVRQTLFQRGFEQKFWKIAIKPGKPVLFGLLGRKPCFGLPGNPAATAATFELFVRPALQQLVGNANVLAPRLKVKLAEAVSGGGKRQNFLWGELQIVNGHMEIIPLLRQGSGQNRSMQKAQALLPVPIGCPGLNAGDEVEVILLRLPQGQKSPLTTEE
ncbi:MAG: molybdopterin molybdotransferase MoeA [Desulfuromusa sp.]|nr:molybdopterin molybdotransferase MoeA [Desulfuromusa sp.]